MSKSLKIWCNTTFPAAINDVLIRGVAPHELVISKSLAKTILHAGEADPALSAADIAFGQPDPKQVIDSPNIKWVHLTTAGYTRYDTAEFKNAMKARGGIFTNSSSVFDLPCAQHLLGMMMAVARQLPQAIDNQRGDRQWVQDSLRAGSYLLDGQSALIYGFGSIAKQLVKYLTPLNVKMTGVRRKPRGDEGIPVVTNEQADELIATTDHLINILPASPETENFFTATRLAKMKPSAVFYNIGRGSTVDQTALQQMLQNKKLAAAYLDVTAQEPLPPNDPLWQTPNCHITPHSAGGHANEFDRLLQHFLINLKNYDEQKPMNDRIA